MPKDTATIATQSENEATKIKAVEMQEDKQGATKTLPVPPAIIEDNSEVIIRNPFENDTVENLAQTAAATIEQSKGADNPATDQTEAEELAEIAAEIEAEQEAARKQQQEQEAVAVKKQKAKELAAAAKKKEQEEKEAKKEQTKKLAAATRKFKKAYQVANVFQKHRLYHEYVQANIAAGMESGKAHEKAVAVLNE